MASFLNADLPCYGKVMEEELEILCILLLTFSIEKGNFSSLGKHSLGRSEITQGAFLGSVFLVRCIHSRWPMEQKMENDNTKEKKER